MTAEENYRLLCEIEANRFMLLQAYQQNPHLLAHADEQIRRIFNSDITGQASMAECDANRSVSNECR